MLRGVSFEIDAKPSPIAQGVAVVGTLNRPTALFGVWENTKIGMYRHSNYQNYNNIQGKLIGIFLFMI